MPDKVEELYAFVMTAEDGDEGVPAFFTEQGWIPLIGADMERIDLLRKAAQNIATSEQQPIKLLRFAGPPEILEVIEP